MNCSLRFLILLLLVSCSSASQAVLFGIDAVYADGTTFMAVYDDPDGDGLCNPCSLQSASATLGSVLQDAVADLPNAFNLDLAHLETEFVQNARVTGIGAAASFFFEFFEPFPSIDFDTLQFDETAAFLRDTVCGLYIGDACVGLLFSEERDGRSSTRSASIAQIPEPATLALMGLGLAGIGYSRKRKAT